MFLNRSPPSQSCNIQIYRILIRFSSVGRSFSRNILVYTILSYNCNFCRLYLLPEVSLDSPIQKESRLGFFYHHKQYKTLFTWLACLITPLHENQDNNNSLIYHNLATLVIEQLLNSLLYHLTQFVLCIYADTYILTSTRVSACTLINFTFHLYSQEIILLIQEALDGRVPIS